MYYVIYLIGIALFLVKGMGYSHLSNFWDSTTLILVILPCLLLLFCTKSLKSFGECFLFPFGKRDYSLIQCRKCLQSLKMVVISTVVSGMICLMISFINMLKYSDSLGKLGRDTGVAILSLYYVLIIYIALLPLRVLLKRHVMILMSADGGKELESIEE